MVKVNDLNDQPTPIEDIDLNLNLIEACRETASKGIRGTCTFSTLVIEQEQPVLRGLNLGDSGYMIIRNSESEPYVLF